MEHVNPDCIVLAIESSCDETSIAIVKNGREVLAEATASQAHLHAMFGGVVPEVASRMHIEAILPVLDITLKKSGLTLNDIDIFSATTAPGLVGALLVGFCAAKSLAQIYNKPFIAVHHIAGHIAANYLSSAELTPPFVSLVVSGGHSLVVFVEDYCKFKVLARTRDDAAGEAFDKLARNIDLPYPGGPHIDRLAKLGDSHKYKLPKVNFKDGSLDFSFSGLKTAAITFLNNYKKVCLANNVEWQDSQILKDFVASYQRAIIEVLLDHSLEIMKKLNVFSLAIAGGVSANSLMRTECNKLKDVHQVKTFFPDLKYCTDNAAMIASMAYYQYVEYLKGTRFKLANQIKGDNDSLINIPYNNFDLFNSYVGSSISIEKYYEEEK